MTHHKSVWPTSKSPSKITIADLNRNASRSFTQFYTAYNNLINAFTKFITADQLLPTDCDQLTRYIRALQLSVHQFNALLDAPSKLPDEIVPRRYQMLFHLHQTNDLSERSLQLIRSFRRVCLEPTSHECRRTREEVVNVIDELLETSQGIDSAYQTLLKDS